MRILKYSFLLALVLSIVSCEKDRTFTEFEEKEQGNKSIPS